MKSVLYTTLIIVFIIYALGVRIETNPFKIHIDSWRMFIGCVLIVMGVIIISCEQYLNGVKKGVDKTIQVLEEMKNNK